MIPFGSREDLKKALGGKQRFKKEDCPFCADIQTNKRVIWKGAYWALLYNNYPYISGGMHIILVPVRHTCYSYDVLPVEYSELGEAQKIVKEYFKNSSYFSFTRESMEERSVEHLHIHFLLGKMKRETLVEMLKAQGNTFTE